MSGMLASQLKKRSQQTPAPAASRESEHRSMPPQSAGHSAPASGGHALSRMQLHSDSLAAPTATSCSKGYIKPSHCPFGGACHTCPSVVQAKLTVSQPGDKYEEEADRTAERIMRMAAPPAGDDEPSDVSSVPISTIQRSCPACEDDEEIHRQPMDESDNILQAKPASGGALAISPALQAQINSIRGGGQPLSGSVRGFFEPRFGYDLGGVRVHTDARAAEAARAVGAQAFAVGQNIMFGSGRYAPETSTGKRLLAHELAHTIQQSDRREPASTGDMLFRTGERPDWCNALVRLVEYEDANGIAATLVRYHPGNSDLLVPLNHDIPSIYGPVDVDWMLRITFSQAPTIAPSIISPSIAQVMGYVTSHVTYFGAKLFWNTIRSFSDEYDFDLSSIFQEANLNAPSVVVHWIHGEPLRHIFAPALELCGQHASSQPRERPASSVAQTEASVGPPALQAKLLPGREPGATPEIDSAVSSLKGGGLPMDPSTRGFMEDRFGRDFSAVRVHTDDKAAESARTMNAVAYTVGRDVVFGAGQYRPQTYEGRELLAHELSHVVQQDGACPSGFADLLPAHSSAEKEADRSASAVMHGMHAGHMVSRGQPVAIARRGPMPMPMPRPAPPMPGPTTVRVGPGARTGPGGRVSVPEPEQRYAYEYDNSLEGILARGRLEAQRYRDIMEAETPTATLERGGKPPDFVTVDGEQEGLWSWGQEKYRVRSFHVLDAIEYEVGRAKTDEDLNQVLVAYIGYIPAPGQWRPTHISPIWANPIKFPDNFDPGGEKRMEVYAAAVARRTGAVPRLGTARAAPRVPENARRRGCRVVPASPLGDDPLASIFCQIATGSMLEYRVTTPYGEWAQFDGMDNNTAYECKCGYRSLFENYNRWLQTGQPRWAPKAMEARDEQMLRQRRVATACGLRLIYYVSNKGVADMLNDRWDGNPIVMWYPWDECS